MFLEEKKQDGVYEKHRSKKGWFWFVEIIAFIILWFIYEQLSTLGINALRYSTISILNLPQTFYYPFSYYVLILPIFFIVFIWGFFIQKRMPESFGFVKNHILSSYLKGITIGFLMFSTALFICIMTSSATINSVMNSISISKLMILFGGFCIQSMSEEVLCRGYFIPSFSRRYPVLVAVFINAIFFAGMHLFNPGITAIPVANMILFSVFASLYFLYTKNIWGIGGLHAMWNFIQGNIYGIHVSGIDMSDTVFTTSLTNEKEILNGGDFGLEGGLVVSFVLLVGIIILGICIWSKKNKKQGRL